MTRDVGARAPTGDGLSRAGILSSNGAGIKRGRTLGALTRLEARKPTPRCVDAGGSSPPS
jgi:hypothetical protein